MITTLLQKRRLRQRDCQQPSPTFVLKIDSMSHLVCMFLFRYVVLAAILPRDAMYSAVLAVKIIPACD